MKRTQRADERPRLVVPEGSPFAPSPDVPSNPSYEMKGCIPNVPGGWWGFAVISGLGAGISWGMLFAWAHQ